jgi:predicted Zn-dependent protease
MRALSYPDLHFLNAASGWMALGNLNEARTEIRGVSLLGRLHPEVFVTHWTICARAGRWIEAHELAVTYTKVAPQQPTGWICLSYALYSLKRRLEAWLILVPQCAAFPDVSAIPYMLARYAAEMGHHRESAKWLAKSAALGGAGELEADAKLPFDLDPSLAERSV